MADYNNHDITDSSSFVNEDSNNSIIKVIGVGGGGCNAVNYMYKQNIPLIKFVICNTDRQALEMSTVPNQLLLGTEITKGGGAGNNPEVGRQCAEASVEDIRALFTDETEMVFITAGMGGGTGTGAAPVVAREAKAAGMLTIGIVTVPFIFEGKKKILKALAGAEEMKKYVDALLIINNENIIELYKDFNFFNAFSKADDTLANAARSISEIISEPCYVNVDFQDVKTTLKDSGSAIIATAVGEGEHRITDAIQNALHSPLLKLHDINTSKRLLFKFICSKDSENPIRAEEIAEITNFTSKLPASIDVKWGIGDDPTMGDKVKITVLASGFDVTITEDEDVIVMSNGGDDKPAKPEKSREEQKAAEQMAQVYGHDKLKAQERDVARMKYVVLKPGQFDDHEVIALLERTPPRNRPPRFNEQLRHLSESQASGMTTHTSGADSGYEQITFVMNNHQKDNEI
ncbi:MAG: cell division protein FtsZ [Candidatus Amulumruptor caecigallinarius]|nr:cell division protein FtsZ [Candidatus Amulumruptor caecigallinarius]